MAFLIRNKTKIDCAMCGKFHPFYTRDCVTIEYPEVWRPYFQNCEKVDLNDNHAMVTTTFRPANAPQGEDIRLAMRSNLKPTGLTEGLLK